MIHLRGINEDKNEDLVDEIISHLRESLTELTDDRDVLFQKAIDYNSLYSIEIIVRLDHYWVQESLTNSRRWPVYRAHGEDINDLYQSFKKSHDEIIQIFDLVNEGVIRSQIDYTSSSFCVSSDETWNWSGDDDDVDDNDADDVIVFNLSTKIKHK